MSESSNSAWPFGEISDKEGLDIAAIFKDSADTVDQGDPFAAPVEPAAPAPTPRDPETPAAPAPKPTAAPPAEKPAPEQPEVSAAAENPIAAAFEQKTAENTKKGLLEKPPVFYHKGVKEEIEDPSMTFEELRIRKSEDFTDLEEGKRVSWSVEYCGIRKEIKDPKGTTIISVKETIERSREFLAALKKTKEKNPCCYVKPKVEMKTKGNAAYKGKFGSLEEARASDTVLTDTKEMREALSSVLSVAPDDRVNLAFEDQKLVFRCSSDWGNASAGIDVIALTGSPTDSYWYSAKQLATCLKALGGTITLGIAQGGMLTISTQDAYYLQNVMRAPAAKEKSKKAIEPPAAKAA